MVSKRRNFYQNMVVAAPLPTSNGVAKKHLFDQRKNTYLTCQPLCAVATFTETIIAFTSSSVSVFSKD